MFLFFTVSYLATTEIIKHYLLTLLSIDLETWRNSPVDWDQRVGDPWFTHSVSVQVQDSWRPAGGNADYDDTKDFIGVFACSPVGLCYGVLLPEAAKLLEEWDELAEVPGAVSKPDTLVSKAHNREMGGQFGKNCQLIEGCFWVHSGYIVANFTWWSVIKRDTLWNLLPPPTSSATAWGSRSKVTVLPEA